MTCVRWNIAHKYQAWACVSECEWCNTCTWIETWRSCICGKLLKVETRMAQHFWSACTLKGPHFHYQLHTPDHLHEWSAWELHYLWLKRFVLIDVVFNCGILAKLASRHSKYDLGKPQCNNFMVVAEWVLDPQKFQVITIFRVDWGIIWMLHHYLG